MAVVGVALLYSTISTPVLSAVFTFSLFVIGNLLEDLRGFGEQSGSAMLRDLLRWLSYVLPDFGAFSAISQAAHGQLIPGYRLVSNSLYTLLYLAVLLSSAVLIFEQREFR